MVDPARHIPDIELRVGVCLTAIRDYEPQIAFNNLLKTARFWLPQDHSGTFNTGLPLPPLDAEGYPTVLGPTEAVGTVFCWSMGDKHPKGNYRLDYDGVGSLIFPHGAIITNSGPGFYDVNIIGDGVQMRILTTDPNDHMRNIRLKPTGSTSDWYTPFFGRLAQFGTIRFTTWSELYNPNLVNWSDRILPGYFTMTTNKGVAWEHMIQLCNDRQRNCYISVPYLYTDAAITSLATLFRDTLDSNLKVYVEYSNEIWNSIFKKAYDYCIAQGLARGYLDPPYAPGSPFDGGQRFHGARTAEIGDIFATVYGAELGARVVRVLGSWNASPTNAVQSMDHEDSSSYTGKAHTHVDALAIAPYSDPGGGAANVAAAISQYMASNIATMAFAATHKTNADARSLDLICYEAGQHSTTNEQVYNDANRDPLMEGVYKDYLDRWFLTVGGDVICMFDFCEKMQDKGGNARWGLLEWMNQPSALAPKWRAVQAWI